MTQVKPHISVLVARQSAVTGLTRRQRLALLGHKPSWVQRLRFWTVKR